MARGRRGARRLRARSGKHALGIDTERYLDFSTEIDIEGVAARSGSSRNSRRLGPGFDRDGTIRRRRARPASRAAARRSSWS